MWDEESYNCISLNSSEVYFLAKNFVEFVGAVSLQEHVAVYIVMEINLLQTPRN